VSFCSSAVITRRLHDRPDAFSRQASIGSTSASSFGATVSMHLNAPAPLSSCFSFFCANGVVAEMKRRLAVRRELRLREEPLAATAVPRREHAHERCEIHAILIVRVPPCRAERANARSTTAHDSAA